MKRLGLFGAAAVVCMAFSPGAEARPNFPTDKFPGISGVTCNTCHVPGEAKSVRNDFGKAFRSGQTWTTALCNEDSDGDTFSNGIELGDPDCDGTGAVVSFPGDANSTPPAPAMCSNMTKEDGEDCDGADLDGKTCADAGDFDGGTLACANDCTFDTAACTKSGMQAMCGNMTKEGDEVCDGADLDGKTCADAGDFDGGTLACANDCTFDTAACTKTPEAMCGNMTKEDGEDCDGADLDGKTCADAGDFDGGTLACGSGCAFDTLNCTKSTDMPDMGMADMGMKDMTDNTPKDMDGGGDDNKDEGCSHVAAGDADVPGALSVLGLLGFFGLRRRRVA